MQAPITVNYTPDGEDWTIVVTGRNETRRATAAGLIAARDQADQLVEQIAPDDERKTVVHLLEGDAYAFTTTYLHARLGLTGHDEAPATRAAATPARPRPNTPAPAAQAQATAPVASPVTTRMAPPVAAPMATPVTAPAAAVRPQPQAQPAVQPVRAEPTPAGPQNGRAAHREAPAVAPSNAEAAPPA